MKTFAIIAIIAAAIIALNVLADSTCHGLARIILPYCGTPYHR